VNKFMTHAIEIEVVYGEIKCALAGIDQWMAPTYVSTPAVSFPGSSYIVPEPYGVVR
jgi:hypothetical protein